MSRVMSSYDGRSSALSRHNIRFPSDASAWLPIRHAMTSSLYFRRQHCYLNSIYSQTNDVIKSSTQPLDGYLGSCWKDFRPERLGPVPYDAGPSVTSLREAPSAFLWRGFQRQPPLPLDVPAAYRDDVMESIEPSSGNDSMRPAVTEKTCHRIRPDAPSTMESTDCYRSDRLSNEAEKNDSHRVVFDLAGAVTPETSTAYGERSPDNIQRFNYCPAWPQPRRDTNVYSFIEVTNGCNEYLTKLLPSRYQGNHDAVTSLRSFAGGMSVPNFRDRFCQHLQSPFSREHNNTRLASTPIRLMLYDYLLSRITGQKNSPTVCATMKRKNAIDSSIIQHGGSDDGTSTSPPQSVASKSRGSPPASRPVLFRPYLDLLAQSPTVDDVTRMDNGIATPSPGNDADDRSNEVAFTGSSCFGRHQRRRAERPSCGTMMMTSQTTALLKRSKRYECDLCGRTFSRSNTLVTHRRIHTGEKPFSCELCGRLFRQPGNLTRHQLTHTASRPYACLVCGKAFNRAANLQAHSRVHATVLSTIPPDSVGVAA